MTAIKRSWQRVDGVLLLDKASGMSSNMALQRARRLYSAAKAGHTGTLDPLATGLLPVCFGEATKFSSDLLDADKIYEADVMFGINTDTGDAEGQVVQQRPVAFGLAQLEAVLAQFRGPLSQIPPMYSALKRDGKPLYELARQGIEVERKARDITIRELTLLEFSGAHCRLRVHCTKGTYIRVLAEDIGNALACGAHLTALRRVAVGSLCIADALSLDQLNDFSEVERNEFLRAPDALLQTLPEVQLEDEATLRFTQGNPVLASVQQGKCRVYGMSRLLGIGEMREDGRLHPKRLVVA